MLVQGLIINYEEVPGGFTPCFNDNCPRAAECLRHIVGQTVPDEPLTGRCVYPASCRGRKCPFFHEARIVREAWGFKPLFKNVLARDERSLRNNIADYLGSKTSYYRYNRGDRKLTPEQQADILGIFAEWGYDTSDMRFEHYRETIDFQGT